MTVDDIAQSARLKAYKPAVLPADLKRFDVGQCFDSCAWNAVYNRKYTYVEGIATAPGDPKKLILHAWLTDGVHAFDPTWRAVTDDGVDKPVPSEYLGIEMPIKRVAQFMKATGYQGVIANYDRNPKLADAAIGGAL